MTANQEQLVQVIFFEENKIELANWFINMKMNFTTLFDINYLTRGVALYRSLEKVCVDFHLYIFAFDDKSFEILNKLSLQNATIISLSDFEDEDLLKVKPTRSKAEYCWTSTAASILYVLNNYKVDSCTYLDADLYFFSSPNVLYEEMNDASILLTEHKFTEEYDNSAIVGTYCVQYETFKNNKDGIQALQWWRDACLAWCYSIPEDGKCGDQKYLNDWTSRFNSVHVLKHPGGSLAPWNIQQHNIFIDKNSKLKGRSDINNEIFDVVVFHFEKFKVINRSRVDLGGYKLTKNVKRLIYGPYIKDLLLVNQMIQKIEPTLKTFEPLLYPFTWKSPFRFVKRHIYGNYNIHSIKHFIND